MRGAPIRTPGGKRHWFYVFAYHCFRLVGKVYFRVTAHGLENVPREGPCLLMPNHVSFLDPPVVGGFTPVEMHYVARENLFGLPILGKLMIWLNGHPIRREGIDRSAIRACAEALEAGWPLLIFPEGTRSPNGHAQPPKGGFGMVLENVKRPVPCVPILIRGTEKAMPRGALFPLPRRISISYGPPFIIPPKGEGESRRDYYDRCVVMLTDAWIAMGADELRP